jgi:N-carbamoylputrescine amidase
MTRLKVAALQVSSVDGEPERNLRNASRFVAEAARAGAQLVLAPEFLACGYRYEESIWRFAEPAGGATETWLAEQADAHRIVIGASFLEAEGDDFFNTFSLFGPDGALGRIRKRSLPFFEGWLFKPCSLPKVIESPIGRLAVGICNDTQTSAFLREVGDARPDLILMPHSAPTPHLPFGNGLFRPLHDAQLHVVCHRYANAFGVPVVMCNKVSRAPTTTAIPILPFLRVRFDFTGGSSICDSDGAVVAQASDEELALVGEVELAPNRKRAGPRPHGYWSFPPRVLAGAAGASMRLFEALGRWTYSRNPRRPVAARRSRTTPG